MLLSKHPPSTSCIIVSPHTISIAIVKFMSFTSGGVGEGVERWEEADAEGCGDGQALSPPRRRPRRLSPPVMVRDRRQSPAHSAWRAMSVGREMSPAERRNGWCLVDPAERAAEGLVDPAERRMKKGLTCGWARVGL